MVKTIRIEVEIEIETEDPTSFQDVVDDLQETMEYHSDIHMKSVPGVTSYAVNVIGEIDE